MVTCTQACITIAEEPPTRFRSEWSHWGRTICPGVITALQAPRCGASTTGGRLRDGRAERSKGCRDLGLHELMVPEPDQQRTTPEGLRVQLPRHRDPAAAAGFRNNPAPDGVRRVAVVALRCVLEAAGRAIEHRHLRATRPALRERGHLHDPLIPRRQRGGAIDDRGDRFVPFRKLLGVHQGLERGVGIGGQSAANGCADVYDIPSCAAGFA